MSVSDADVKNLNKVAVIGPTTATDLFGDDAEAVGQIIRIKGIQFNVVGVTVSKGTTGFNNQEICLMPTPMLTSVDQRVEETVRSAVDLLLEQIDRPFVRLRICMIEPMLVVRGSTGPAPGFKQ